MERDGALGKEHKLEVRDPDPLKNCAGSLYYLRWMIFFYITLKTYRLTAHLWAPYLIDTLL